MIDLEVATAQLSYAAAIALRDGRTNGEMQRAIAAYEEAMGKFRKVERKHTFARARAKRSAGRSFCSIFRMNWSDSILLWHRGCYRRQRLAAGGASGRVATDRIRRWCGFERIDTDMAPDVVAGNFDGDCARLLEP